MNSVITVLYFNGRVYEDNDGVIFEGSKKAIQIKCGISFNALKKKIGDKVKFLVSGKYIALQICDDEDFETMLESFKQQDQMSVLELYIEKDVAGGSMFHSAYLLTSCGNYLSNDETQPPTNMNNLHVDEDDDDDDDDYDDYLVSNSYVEESLDEDDSVDGISDTDDEVTDMIQPVRIVHQQKVHNELKIHFGMMLYIITIPTGVILMRRTFAVWRCRRPLMLANNYMLAWNLILKMRSKMQSNNIFKVVESKSNKYVVCCLNKSAECPCPFYMREILSKKIDTWKVTQWGGPHV
ncbi:hypothetical protein GmHk_03G007314 [Glycine max]|nr:hypothetical protein GmHk_03G007314 [Glycine max]